MVAGAPPPEEECTGQCQHQAGAVTPGTDGLAKIKEFPCIPITMDLTLREKAGEGIPGRCQVNLGLRGKSRVFKDSFLGGA